MRSPNQKNWNNPEFLVEEAGPQITSFEQIVGELKLEPADYENSAEFAAKSSRLS